MRDITLEEVIDAYMDCRKRKARTINALKFELDRESNLINLHKEITEGTYQIGQSITFIVEKPRKREIFAADFRDRIVHHLVIRKVEHLLEQRFIDDNYNCRKGKGTLYGINRLQEKLTEKSENFTKKDCFIGRFDMESFFMSIHKPTLWHLIKELIENNYNDSDKETVLRLTKQIIMHCPAKNCILRSPSYKWRGLDSSKSLFTTGDDYGLPIGNLPSQVFANYYLNDFDQFMNALLPYGRYVDDFYILGTKKQILNSILITKEKLEERQIRLHRKKIYIQHATKGLTFIGARIMPGRKYAENRTVHNAHLMIRKYNETINKKIYAEDFVQKLNSYFGYLRQFNSYNIRMNLYKDINKEWFKYIYFTGGLQKAVVRNPFKKLFKIKKTLKKIRHDNKKPAQAIRRQPDRSHPGTANVQQSCNKQYDRVPSVTLHAGPVRKEDKESQEHHRTAGKEPRGNDRS